MAALDWGLKCLRYEISKSTKSIMLVVIYIRSVPWLMFYYSLYFRGHIPSTWSAASYGDASRSRT